MRQHKGEEAAVKLRGFFLRILEMFERENSSSQHHVEPRPPEELGQVAGIDSLCLLFLRASAG